MLVLGVALAACGSISIADYVTSQGFEVYVEGDVSPDFVAIDRQIDIVVDVITARYPDIYDRATIEELFTTGGFAVRVRAANFKCREAASGMCAGVTSGATVWFVWDDCVGLSALAHELVHLLNDWIEHRNDYGHTDARFFGPDSVTVEASWIACRELCGDICTEERP